MVHLRVRVVASSDVEQGVFRVLHLVWDSDHQVVPPDGATGHRVYAQRRINDKVTVHFRAFSVGAAQLYSKACFMRKMNSGLQADLLKQEYGAWRDETSRLKHMIET